MLFHELDAKQAGQQESRVEKKLIRSQKERPTWFRERESLDRFELVGARKRLVKLLVGLKENKASKLWKKKVQVLSKWGEGQ